MVTPQELYALRTAVSFMPFRLVLTDGQSVEVKTQECFVVGRHYTIVGLVDPWATDDVCDRWTTVWYTQIARIEPLAPGATR